MRPTPRGATRALQKAMTRGEAARETNALLDIESAILIRGNAK